MFRSAVAVLFTSIVLAGCQAGVPATDKAGEDGTAALAVGTGAPTEKGSSVATPTTDAPPAASAPSAAAASTDAPSASTPAASAAAPSASTTAPAASASVRPTFKLVTVPAGTTLNVTLSSAVGSDTSNIEDAVRGKIASDILVDGLTAIPAGSPISGSVTDAERSGRVKGRATVAFRFDHIEVRDETSRIQTSSVAREAEADTRDDVKKGGIGAGIGAIVGGVTGGKKGAAIGAGVGGAGTVMATRGKEVHLAVGSRVRVTLRDALDVRVPLE